MRTLVVKYLIIKCIFALFLIHVNIVNSCAMHANLTSNHKLQQNIEVNWSTKRLPNEFIVQFVEYLNKESRETYIREALSKFKVRFFVSFDSKN